MKSTHNQETVCQEGTTNQTINSIKYDNLSLEIYANPVFKINSNESKTNYIININKSDLEDYEMLNIYITYKKKRDPNEPEFTVLNVDNLNEELTNNMPLIEPNYNQDIPTSSPIYSTNSDKILNSDNEQLDTVLNGFAKQDAIELVQEDLFLSTSNKINLDGNFDIENSPLADLRIPSLKNEFRQLPNMDADKNKSLLKESKHPLNKIVLAEEDDDVVCIDLTSPIAKSKQNVKNEPSVSSRQAFAPVNTNIQVLPSCSPVNKRKLVDKENKNAKKSKTIKEILKQELKPEVPSIAQSQYLIKKEIKTSHEIQKILEHQAALTQNTKPAVNNPGMSHNLSSINKNEKTEFKQQATVPNNNQTVNTVNNLDSLESDENVDLVTVESYVNYRPKKLTLGAEHPDVIVETTSLASVDPPEITYNLRIPSIVYETNKLSALQLEAVVYACQTHEKFLPNGERSGFLIGDGAGVGKGRTIAGIILENIKHGRKKAVWFSVSNDLKLDARRDLNDIGISQDFPIKSLTEFGYKPIKMDQGVIFSTYQALISKSKSSTMTRLNQLIDWVNGGEFEGLIIFDESHKAKNLVPEKGAKPTQCGQAVKELQARLPKARIVYASATGATDCKNLAYMNRLGLWGVGAPFNEFSRFHQFIEKTGVSAMEVVALDLKWQGLFLARQLSFTGATFKIQEVELDRNYQDVYDRSVKLWIKIKAYLQNIDELSVTNNKGMTAFWGAHQRFFRYLCIASKVKETVRLAKEAIGQGRSVVIGLQSTGEAQALKQDEIVTESLSSTAYGVLKDILKTIPDAINLPQSGWTRENNNYFNYYDDSDSESDDCSCSASIDLFRMRNTFRARDEYNNVSEEMAKDVYMSRLSCDLSYIKREANELKKFLPPNTLDQLVDQLGGPENVAEMTGRKMHTVCTNRRDDEDENDENIVPRRYALEKRAATDQKARNIDEKNAFMNGEKHIAIISDAASCGISLQAHKDYANKSRRLHITLELPWSADKAIQQFGRTHRSNQVCAPDYIFLISKLAGEKRFASSVAKRIESMNAITHGDRNATKSRDLSGFNMESKHGNKAIEKVLQSISQNKPITEDIPLPNYPNFFYEAQLALKGVDILFKKVPVKTFLNRILGCKVNMQNALFNYFESVLESEVAVAKKEGRFDEGINDRDLSKRDVLAHYVEEFILSDKRKVDLHFIRIKTGMPWRLCKEIYEKNITDGYNKNGFYYPYEVRNQDLPYLAVQSSTGLNKYWLYTPTHGKLTTKLSAEELRDKFRKANFSLDKIMTSWDYNYQKTDSEYINVLGGSILTIFLKISDLFGEKKCLSMVRVNLGNNDRIIGIQIPYMLIDRVKATVKEFIKPVETD